METLETFGDLLGSIVDEQIKKINTEKEKLLQQRIHQLIGTKISLEEECKRMFPRIKRRICNTSVVTIEEYWWNDGSEEGKCLISFFMPNIIITPFKSSSPFEGGSINVEIQYK
jgi:hypothetical protein